MSPCSLIVVMTGERNLLHQCRGGEEIIYLLSLQYSLAGSPGFLDLGWCSAGLLGVNQALLSHSNQPGYVNRLRSSSLGNMVCQRGGGGEVVISGYYTNTVWLGKLQLRHASAAKKRDMNKNKNNKSVTRCKGGVVY